MKLEKKFTRLEVIEILKKRNHWDLDIKNIMGILRKCPFCKEEPVGEVSYTYSTSTGRKSRQTEFGVKVLFVGRICSNCENKFERELYKKPDTTKETKKTELNYKQFLEGNLYPEIKVTHTRHDKTATATARLKDSTKFYKVAK